MIQLHVRLKRMVRKAHTMEWSIQEVRHRIDAILHEYGVRRKLPIRKEYIK